MKRLAAALLCSLFLSTPALSCVGKTIVIGADKTPRSRLVAQILAILINERTGTTVKITDFPDPETIQKGITTGDVDIAVDYTGRALTRLGLTAPEGGEAALKTVRTASQERWNLAWMPPLGFSETGDAKSLAAPVVRKDTLKKFPALPRLIAKTEGVLPDAVLGTLTASPDLARAAREFLRNKKLI